MSALLRALIVSYAFPPVGGAGVQRVLKLVKYLPSHGVVPAVLTVRNPSVPLHDESLAQEVPAGTTILRARTFEPGYAAKRVAWSAAAGGGSTSSPSARVKAALARRATQLLVPDPQVLWLPAAGAALARRLASREADDVVFVSGPPFSQFLLAALARARKKVAIVLDYRDEWTTTRGLYEMGSSARSGAWLEPAILRTAHAVTTATEAFRAELLDRFPFLHPDRVDAIPNGYDPADFPASLPAPPADRLVLTYVGTVFKLTSASGLLAALRLLHAREPALARLLEVRFVGRIVETEAASFEGSEALGVRRLGYVPHDEAVAELAGSHVALCLLDDLPGTERIYPAKIFEIMYTRRPCLALAADGVLARLVHEHKLGTVLHPRDAEGICGALLGLLHAFRDGKPPARADAVDIERFDRRRLAGDFARVFQGAAADARQEAQRPPRSESAHGWR